MISNEYGLVLCCLVWQVHEVPWLCSCPRKSTSLVVNKKITQNIWLSIELNPGSAAMLHEVKNGLSN